MDLARDARCRVLVGTADIAGVSRSDRIALPLPGTKGLRAALRFAPSALRRPAWLFFVAARRLAMPTLNAPRREDGSMLRVEDAGRLLTRTPFN